MKCPKTFFIICFRASSQAQTRDADDKISSKKLCCRLIIHNNFPSATLRRFLSNDASHKAIKHPSLACLPARHRHASAVVDVHTKKTTFLYLSSKERHLPVNDVVVETTTSCASGSIQNGNQMAMNEVSLLMHALLLVLM